jgi:hypothetical protein
VEALSFANVPVPPIPSKPRVDPTTGQPPPPSPKVSIPSTYEELRDRFTDERGTLLIIDRFRRLVDNAGFANDDPDAQQMRRIFIKWLMDQAMDYLAEKANIRDEEQHAKKRREFELKFLQNYNEIFKKLHEDLASGFNRHGPVHEAIDRIMRDLSMDVGKDLIDELLSNKHNKLGG